MNKDEFLLKTLRRGDLVIATVNIDPEIVPVLAGTLGVVFEEAEFHEPGSGPMVRWVTGYACNVYGGWVRVVDHEVQKIWEDDFDKLSQKVWSNPRVQEKLQKLVELDKARRKESK